MDCFRCKFFCRSCVAKLVKSQFMFSIAQWTLEAVLRWIRIQLLKTWAWRDPWEAVEVVHAEGMCLWHWRRRSMPRWWRQLCVRDCCNWGEWAFYWWHGGCGGSCKIECIHGWAHCWGVRIPSLCCHYRIRRRHNLPVIPDDGLVDVWWILLKKEQLIQLLVSETNRVPTYLESLSNVLVRELRVVDVGVCCKAYKQKLHIQIIKR